MITSCMWLVFARLERSSMTAEMRRANQCKMNVRGIQRAFRSIAFPGVRDENRCQAELWHCSMGFQLALTLFWRTCQNVLCSFRDSLTRLKCRFIGTTPRIFCETLTESMMEVQPTDVELCYIVCDLCFYHLGNKLGGRIQEVTERLQAILSDDLHSYYLKINKTSRYSHRLNKLLKINQQYKVCLVQKILFFYKKVWDAHGREKENDIPWTRIQCVPNRVVTSRHISTWKLWIVIPKEV